MENGGQPGVPPLRRKTGHSEKWREGYTPRWSFRPKSRRLAAVGLEMRLRARSCPFGAIHLQPLPYGSQETLPGLGRGAPWGSRRKRFRPKGHSHPPPCGGTFSLEGGRLGRLIAAPTANTEAGPSSRRGRTLAGPPTTDQLSPARQSQARLWDRTNNNFGTARPQWAGRIRKRHSDFARRKSPSISQVRVPRNGVWGKRSYGPRRSIAEP